MNKPNTEVRSTSLRMPEQLAARVAALARDERRSVNQMMNLLIEDALSHRTKGQSDGSARSGS